MTDIPVYKIEIRFGPDLLIEKTYPDSTFLKDLSDEFRIATTLDGVTSVRLWHDKLLTGGDSVLLRTWYSPKTNEEVKLALQDRYDTVGMSQHIDGTVRCLVIGCNKKFYGDSRNETIERWKTHVDEDHQNDWG